MRLEDAVTNIGEMFKRVLSIEQADVDAAVAAQNEHPERRLGQCFVDLGLASPEQVESVLSLQERLRKPKNSKAAANAASEMLTQAVERNMAQARTVVALAEQAKALPVDALPVPAPPVVADVERPPADALPEGNR